MELIWSLLRIVAGHARELVKRGVLSAEDELILKVCRFDGIMRKKILMYSPNLAAMLSIREAKD